MIDLGFKILCLKVTLFMVILEKKNYNSSNGM